MRSGARVESRGKSFLLTGSGLTWKQEGRPHRTAAYLLEPRGVRARSVYFFFSNVPAETIVKASGFTIEANAASASSFVTAETRVPNRSRYSRPSP